MQSRMKAQDLCFSREPVALPQATQTALRSRNTILDPSGTYICPLFQESFEQMARAAINTTSGRTLGRVFPPERTNRFSSNSERASQPIVPASPILGETIWRYRVVDIRQILAVRNFFLQEGTLEPA